MPGKDDKLRVEVEDVDDPALLTTKEKVEDFETKIATEAGRKSPLPLSTARSPTPSQISVEWTAWRRTLLNAESQLNSEFNKSPIEPVELAAAHEYYLSKYGEYEAAASIELKNQKKAGRAEEYLLLREELDESCRLKYKWGKRIPSVLTLLQPPTSPGGPRSPSSPDSSLKLLLPKRELPQFTGEIREWLSFWAAFQEIDGDASLSETDKFHYLVQSTKEGTAARKLLQSYPFSGSNYTKALSSLKERFGRNNVLVKVYVRDLLQLVIEASTGKKMDLCDLVTHITSQIRNLESLGVATDQCAQVLYPVVESCLPTEVLQAWQRSAGFKEELDELIQFLQAEVNSFTERRLANFTLGTNAKPSSSTKSNSPKKDGNGSGKGIKTTAGFLNTSEKKCLLCEKDNHLTTECRIARSWDGNQVKKILQEKRACYRCLRTGHSTLDCRSKETCIICNKPHHHLICFKKVQSGKRDEAQTKKSEKVDQPPSTPPPQQPTQEPQQGIGGGSSQASMANVLARPEVLLKTLTVVVHGPRGAIKARAAFDSLSSSSYIKEELAERLALRVVGQETVVHQVFGGNESSPQKHRVYKAAISGVNEKKKYQLEISGIPSISGALKPLPPGKYLDECAQRGIQLTDLDKVSDGLDILIGADYCDDLHLGGEYIKLQEGPMAIHTKVGWVLSGRLPNRVPRENQLAMLYITQTQDEMTVSDMWSLEALGIKDPADVKTRQELEESAEEYFVKTVQQEEDGRYTVALPWIDGHPPLPHNREVAHKRLLVTTKKLKEEGQTNKYHEVFQTWIKNGFIEEARTDTTRDLCHYLPHRAVIKEGSTTPIRPVFDASAKTRNNPSLNDCLEKGPNYLELIPAIMTRLRMYNVVVLADIEKAFQQMWVSEGDRDKLRFLWWEDPDDCNMLVEYRHARVPFGATSSPFLLAATLKHHINNTALSVSTLDEAYQFQKEACEILLAGKFNLRDWEIGPSPTGRMVGVLGLIWNSKEDTLLFDCRKLLANVEVPATKRNLYRMINMLYDPLGFASPYTVVAKILLKKVCMLGKIGWDDPLTEEHALEFERWKKQMKDLQEISLPRHLNVASEHKMSLHVFNDASKDCFATSVFLRVDNGQQITVNLIQSKTRVSPKKGVTIPRLELLSCLIGARLSKTILEDMGIEIPVWYWTDSTTALTWIQKEDNWATFVNNRVRQIRELTDPQSWRHVPGNLNPADLPSRGCSAKKLLESAWWNGPDWLYRPESEWSHATPIPDELEVNKEKKKTVITAVNLSIPKPENLNVVFLRLSKYPRMLRILALALRFIKKLKKLPVAVGEQTTEEIIEAEQYLHRYIQKDFEEGIMKKMRVTKDKFGTFHLQSRLLYGEAEESFKRPVLLPGKHPIVKRLILHHHEMRSHSGVQFLQAYLREKYWITDSRRSIRNVIHNCAGCRRFLATRCEVPEAALPPERISTTRAFQTTGVDVTGPLFIEKKKKVWIVLFTCATYRAVHMELLHGLSTEDFLMAFQKFINRFGRPHTVFSDNGTNFAGASNLLRSVRQDQIQEFASLHQIHWRFNPPTAAWWGGWWERLIGLVKQLLRRVLGKRSVKLSTLEVLITEVECAMNDRPLTYLSEDADDLLPLTPAHFLRDLPVAALPEVELADGQMFRINLNKIQKMKRELRERFRKEYLGLLVHRGKSNKTVIINPGDTVLIEQDNQKRIDWPMGVITEIFPGRDGLTRVAKIKTTRGIMTRPLQRLFLLEATTTVRDDAPEPRSEPEEEDNN